MKLRVRPHRPRSVHLEAGSALLMAVFVVGSLMMLSVALLATSTSSSREQSANTARQRAFYLAEAGVSEGLTALRAGATGNIGSIATPAYLGTGVFWVEATPSGNETTLLVSAMWGSGRAGLEVVVGEVRSQPFGGMFDAYEDIVIGDEVFIDAFNTWLGPYAPQVVNTENGVDFAHERGRVRSNGDVDIGADTNIIGKARPGPTSSITLGPGAYVSQSTTPLADYIRLIPIEVPTLVSLGPYSVPPGGSRSIPPGSYGFDDFGIGDSGELTIVGPATIVVASYTQGAGGRLLVDATAGPVTIYCTGAFAYDATAEIDTLMGAPLDLAFMCTTTGSIDFAPSTTFRGGLFAPGADLTIGEDSEIFGSIVASRITTGDRARFHFDEHLLTREITSPEDHEIVSWTVVEAAGGQFNALRQDPFELLGLDRGSLPRPSDAWDL
ncbi:MAG: hypothetical protein E2O39_14820 [Planctomycetota bacterium]|nr:MAG: hypothetical protein E2O39_14820 [Planctomycetota bacterium]